MEDLKKLVQQLKVVQKRADTNLEEIPWQTRSAWAAAKADAQEAAAKLREQYFRRVRANTVGMFVFGDPERVARFCSLADDMAGVQQVNAGSIYQRLAQRIEGSLGQGREFGPTQLQGLIEGLKNINHEMGVRVMQMPGLREIVAPQNTAELISYIRRLVQSAVGDDLLRMFVDQKINEAAVNTEFAGNLFPVAVTGAERGEVAALAGLFTNNVSVEVGTSEDGEVNEEYVLNRLNSFKEKLKSH